MKLRIVALCAFAGLGALLLTAPSASAQILNKNHYLCRKVKDLKIPAKFAGSRDRPPWMRSAPTPAT